MVNLEADVQHVANVKLASLKDYIQPALAGAGILTGVSAVPSMLSAYANDEDILKSLASTASWTLPLGALLGTGTVPAGKLMKLLTETLPGQVSSIVEKIPTKMDMLELSRSTVSDILDRVAVPAKQISSSVQDMGRELGQTGVDIKDLLKDIGLEATSIKHF